jgi:hypothetical protein
MEQQEPNVVFPRPSLQKYEHGKTAASEGTHLREFKDNNLGVCLRDHGFAQLIADSLATILPALPTIANSPMLATVTFSMTSSRRRPNQALFCLH